MIYKELDQCSSNLIPNSVKQWSHKWILVAKEHNLTSFRLQIFQCTTNI